MLIGLALAAALGCGSIEAWQHSKLAKDLPGCDGELSHDATDVDRALHDSKVFLEQAEKSLNDFADHKQVDELINKAVKALRAAPDEPRLLEARRVHFSQIKILRDRMYPPR